MFEAAEAMRCAVKEIAAQPLDVGLGTELGAQIVELHRLAAALDAEILRRTAAFDRANVAAGDGFCSTVPWLVAKAHLSAGEAMSRVRAARALDEALPATALAYASGEIGYGHVRAISTVTRGIPADRLPDGERYLLTKARRQDAGGFASTAREWRARTDYELSQRDQDYREDMRRLSASKTFQNMVAIDGVLDPMVGETVLTALNALMQKQGPEDTRTPVQRRHDALGEMARIALDSGALPEYGGAKPHLNILVDLNTLTGDLSHLIDTRLPSGDWVSDIDTNYVAELCCDATVIRIVMRGDSEVLDVGRATRVISPAMRRALIARDTCCVFPGCGRPHRWCDAHHLLAWENGGETALTNLALLCRYHHRLIHRGWTLHRQPTGQWTATSPNGNHITTDPPERAGPLALLT